MDRTVRVPPWATHVVSDHTDMTRAPRPVDPSTTPRIELHVPDDGYLEYGFLDADGEMRADPDNAARGDNPWYPEVSALAGPEYRPHPLADPPTPPRPYEVERLRIGSEHLHQSRRVIVATPPDPGDQPLPWVLVQDGVAFYRLARTADVLAALVDRGEARPARLVFVEPVERNREYAFHAGYRAFVIDELLPDLRGRYAFGGELVALGASLGGLFAATLGLEHPDLVHTVAALSGAFLGHPEDPDAYRGRRSWVAERLEAGAPAPGRWVTEVGTLEWLTGVNRRVRDALVRRGADHSYAEHHAGHNWTHWRDALPGTLAAALRP